MKIPNPSAEQLQACVQGDLAAIDAVLRAIEPPVYNLAVRMLGQRDDAADATQEILLKVVTHLGSFRAEAAFSTWVFQVARNHLLTASTRARESAEISLEALDQRLQAGLEFNAAHGSGERSLTPEDKLAARQTALSCTQSMLMALDREHRLVFVLDLLFDLSSKDGADVAGLTADAYRQRLSRARARLDAFTQRTCGLVQPEAACRCGKQQPALQQLRRSGAPPPSVIAVHAVEHADAERAFDGLVRLSNAAALLRLHPEYRAPEAMRGAIRAVLQAEGYGGDRPALQ
jgi:RNA polymerase sigma factor (sigma-70 family)